MLVSLTVLAIAEEGYSATVKIGLNDGERNEETVLDDVFISGGTKYRFLNKELFEIGKTYTCANNSNNYELGPLKLVRTCAYKSGKLMFHLKYVNEGQSKTIEYASPKGNIIRSRTFKTIPPSKWFRYSDFFTKNRKAWIAREEAKVQANASA